MRANEGSIQRVVEKVRGSVGRAPNYLFLKFPKYDQPLIANNQLASGKFASQSQPLPIWAAIRRARRRFRIGG